MSLEKINNLPAVRELISKNEFKQVALEFPGKEMITIDEQKMEQELAKFIDRQTNTLDFVLIPQQVNFGSINILNVFVFPEVEAA